MSLIKTAPELANAISATYLIDLAVAVVFFLAMIVTAFIINYDYGKVDPIPARPEEHISSFTESLRY